MPEQAFAQGGETPANPRTNSVVKVVLRVGLALALVLLAVGLVIQLSTGHDQAIQVKMFDLLAPRSTGEKIMALGTLVLTLTPAVGVLTVVANWVLERDRRFVAVGAVVLTVLTASVVLGLVG